ncbi:phage tail protein I [Fuscibacter oryzae]|uniref:Phage tail protein I n=1 Tax=Fuscibacter oryzae TaxID=2803939 RepID=A0A8J7MQG1_9RHOB|nr:phage tail protein I [Fuscibacter oryzae]MBL4929325.1 phage tail protein I [Fuscibacter oryzae]
MSETLLPSNATEAEVALDLATARIGEIPIVARTLWNPETCPTYLLPWLAWALGVDEWDSSWSEDAKRATIAASVDIHRHKGTVAAVKRAVAAAGLGDATLQERYGRRYYDGTFLHDGSIDYLEPDHWAEYRLVLSRPISIAQADQVRRVVGAVAPVRSHLKALDFTEALNLENAQIAHDGTYTYGVA